MTTVARVLQEHAVTASEAEVAAELRALLASPPPGRAPALTADEANFLAEHAGVPRASAKQRAALSARSAARAVREAAESLSRTEVAVLLGVDQTRISHRVREGSLYSYAGASNRRRYPSWQFVDGAPLPHLAEALERLPQRTHPVTVRTFMTTVDDTLRLDGAPVSPVQWLAAGGRPEAVAERVETLGEQV